MFDFSAERTVQSVDESLRRLGLDYIDVIQVILKKPFTKDDVIKPASIIILVDCIFHGSYKLPCFLNFPVSCAHPEKLCNFYWLQL